MNQHTIASSLPLELTAEEVAVITRPVNGRGGFQSLLRALCKSLDGSTLHLTPALARRVTRYGTRYGCGGFQDRLARVIAAAQRV